MNVDALVARARDEVAARRTFATEMSSGGSEIEGGATRQDAPLPVAALPDPRVEATHSDALMPLAGRAFVASAYRAVLGREADAHGLEHFTAELRAGRLTRADLLLALAQSEEGRAKAQCLAGLEALGERRLRHEGFLGRLRALRDFLREGPALRRELERLEHDLAEREHHLASVIDALASALGETRQRLQALDDAKAPREASLHVAMHVAALQTRVRELQESAAPR